MHGRFSVDPVALYFFIMLHVVSLLIQYCIAWQLVQRIFQLQQLQ